MIPTAGWVGVKSLPLWIAESFVCRQSLTGLSHYAMSGGAISPENGLRLLERRRREYELRNNVTSICPAIDGK